MSVESIDVGKWSADDWEQFYRSCCESDMFPVWQTHTLPSGEIHIELAVWCGDAVRRQKWRLDTYREPGQWSVTPADTKLMVLKGRGRLPVEFRTAQIDSVIDGILSGAKDPEGEQ